MSSYSYPKSLLSIAAARSLDRDGLALCQEIYDQVSEEAALVGSQVDAISLASVVVNAFHGLDAPDHAHMLIHVRMYRLEFTR
ncbi:hypothetical protein MesoLj131b_38150 [Mesorhizobium sp. 131-2-5]|uniref:hypothetical protein n=1 Tax=Mesorhizobium sp. 131-2-5 TaxID=2744519 RepID=UPI001927249F|nr:hypothetical protein [Mesorhizobium sp. 131-2-5]BCH01816.1 hypothetical protein MesoLj131b_38150 [Mesorhizobium sp. 131-2-5]